MIPVEAVVKRQTEAPPPSRDVSQIAEAEVRALEVAEAPRPVTRTLRRDESVIAEAVKLRGTPGQRVATSLKNTFGGSWAAIRRAFVRGTVVQDLSRAFSKLSPAARAGVVAAPFFVAIVLASWALLRDPAPAPRAAPLAQVAQPGHEPAKVVVSRTLEGLPAAPGAAAPASAAPAPAAPASAAPELALPAPIAPAMDPTPARAAAAPAAPDGSALDKLRQGGAPPIPLSVSEVVRTLPARASLYAAPKKGAPRTVSLPAGTEVLTYPGVPVPAGWLVARKPLGEIGFVRESAFEPKATKLAGVEDAERPAPKARKKASSGLGLDDDRPLRASFGEDRPRDEARGSRRRDLDDGAAAPKRRASPAASPKAKRSNGKPLTADDLLLR